MVSTVKILAEDFFSLTGRPISTMTMDEYISLRRYAESSSNSAIQMLQSNSETTPDLHEVGMDKGRAPLNEERNTTQIPEEKCPQEKQKILPITGQSPTKMQENALSMLKAVSG